MGDAFSKILADCKKEVWPRISKRLPSKGDFAAILREYPERQGKYLRPALVLLGTELFSGGREKALGLAAAVQLSEEWLLVHDDIEDHSALRRGAPSLPALYGEELALNAGDALHILMWRTALDAAAELEPEPGRNALRLLGETLFTTTEGQHEELAWNRGARVPLPRDYFKMAGKKCAAYSFSGPLSLGALAAGAPERELRRLRSWAAPLGIAFQMGDDILNLTAPAALGKSGPEDVLEGKFTLIAIHTLRAAPAKERRELLRLLRLPPERKSPEDIARLLAAIAAHGSINYARREGERLLHKAAVGFRKQFEPDPGAKRRVQPLFDFVKSRLAGKL